MPRQLLKKYFALTERYGRVVLDYIGQFKTQKEAEDIYRRKYGEIPLDTFILSENECIERGVDPDYLTFCEEEGEITFD